MLQKVVDGIGLIAVRICVIAVAAILLFVVVRVAGVLIHMYQVDARTRQVQQERHPHHEN